MTFKNTNKNYNSISIIMEQIVGNKHKIIWLRAHEKLHKEN